MGGIWRAERSAFTGGEKLAFLRQGRVASFRDVLAGWQYDPDCRACFVDGLSQTGFAAFFWEMPPIARNFTEIAYECVLIGSPTLAAVAPDSDAFAGNFAATRETVATFPNLGGDALLVVPRQIGECAAYAHLAAFLRSGPDGQKHEFLWALGHAAECELRTRTGRIWISTSGSGVAWLHARLDVRPKYYQHRPYREC